VVGVCGLKGVLEQNISELSRGYRQRVGFAQAILHNPEVLIMDEPTSGLDPNQAEEVRSLIRELKKEKTVILSTHILSEVQAVCNRVLIINKSKIVASGTTGDLQSMVQGREKVYLEVSAPGDPSVMLGSLEGTQNLVRVKSEGGRYGYELESGSDIREKLYDLSVRQNWKILELRSVKMSLEEVFRKLTSPEEEVEI
jgi:ABC-2 type transport system ATP-binding protein